MKDLRKQLYNRIPLKILSFLSVNIQDMFSAKDIAKETKSSTGAINQGLRLLLELNILSREKKGNMFLYKLNGGSFVLKQFKIFETMLYLQPLVKEIQPYCYKIVLYGSTATGTNIQESDIDLFIKTEYRDRVQKCINKYLSDDFNIQAVIQDPLEIEAAKKEDKVYFSQVRKGITLWEGRPVYETV